MVVCKAKKRTILLMKYWKKKSINQHKNHIFVRKDRQMQESQNIEWKENWKDEYLKWICGFANANGGKIIIGKNDKGEIVGLKKSQKLLEDIPNKVRDILGIVVDVNLHKSEKGDYLEIIVENHPFPVNYKGQYHYRSGSTKQELKGAALDKFMLQKKGKISNKEYQEICKVSKGTATKELRELTDKYDIFKRKGSVGAGTLYIIKEWKTIG